MPIIHIVLEYFSLIKIIWDMQSSSVRRIGFKTHTITNMLLVHNSTFVKMISTNPTGNTNALISVASAGLLCLKPGEPPATTRSNAAPSEMKTPPRKDLMLKSRRESCALAIPACSANRRVSTGVCASAPDVRLGGARVRCSCSAITVVVVRFREGGG